MPKQNIDGSLYRHYVTGTAATECIISAHGHYLPQHTFTPGIGVTLRYYTAHGTALGGVHVRQMVGLHFPDVITLGQLSDQPAPVQTVIGNGILPTRDYNLSKYKESGRGFNSSDYDVLHRWLQNLYQTDAVRYKDIITIRNRSIFMKSRHIGGLRLSTVVNLLNGAGLNYAVYHCSFCRSNALGGMLACFG